MRPPATAPSPCYPALLVVRPQASDTLRTLLRWLPVVGAAIPLPSFIAGAPLFHAGAASLLGA